MDIGIQLRSHSVSPIESLWGAFFLIAHSFQRDVYLKLRVVITSGIECEILADILTGASRSRNVATLFVALDTEYALQYIRLVQRLYKSFAYK